MAAATINTTHKSVVGDLRLAIVNLTGVTTNTYTPGWDVILAVEAVSKPSTITGIAIGASSVTTPPAVTFTSSAAITAETVMVWGR